MNGGPASGMPARAADASAADQARMAFVLHLRERGIADVNVLRALETVPRERFVPHRYADLAWRDIALPIACGQVMPDPYVVAKSMEALAISRDHRVLEIGAGSGYATAILSRLASEVVSYERYRSLAEEAAARLRAAGIDNVRLEWADGLAAACEPQSFDRIILHLALKEVPPNLLAALTEGGRRLFARAGGPGHPPCLVVTTRSSAGTAGEIFVAEARYSSPESGLAAAL